MQKNGTAKPPQQKGGRPPEGPYRGLRIPDDLWEWARKQTGNASETIRQLIRQEMKRQQR